MAQFIVRDLEDDVIARLRRCAAHHGRSMGEEARHILRNAVKEQNQRLPKLGSRIAARFAKTGLTTDLPELQWICATRRSQASRSRGALRLPPETHGISGI